MEDDDDTRDDQERELDVPDEDDAAGQVFTWKLKRSSPEAQEDTEGQSIPPRPERRLPDAPLLEEEDTEGHAIGGVGSPLPPVD